uniref:Transmembrane protein 161A n=1 Tax=Cairina moschata TaxID=8855 RepID=A0A8C3BVV5_CAIMO
MKHTWTPLWHGCWKDFGSQIFPVVPGAVRSAETPSLDGVPPPQGATAHLCHLWDINELEALIYLARKIWAGCRGDAHGARARSQPQGPRGGTGLELSPPPKKKTLRTQISAPSGQVLGRAPHSPGCKHTALRMSRRAGERGYPREPPPSATPSPPPAHGAGGPARRRRRRDSNPRPRCSQEAAPAEPGAAASSRPLPLLPSHWITSCRSRAAQQRIGQRGVAAAGGGGASCGRLCADPGMAVMGVQVVVSLLAASVMQKLAPHCSFARWLLCNGRRVNGVLDDKPLSMPRDIDLRLDTSPITAVDALVLRYFLEYQWFVDFAVYSTAVYIFTEGYFCLADPQKETNIGVLWCLLTVVFSVKVFFMVMRHYFRSEEGGERSVCLTFAFFFLLLAMVVLVIREDYLEFGLEPGLAGVSSNLESVLKQRGWEWTVPLAKLAFKLGLVALCSFLGACLTFPGLRLAQTHLDALRMAADKPLSQVLLHTSFLAPVIVVVMWIKPISRDFLLHAPMGKQTVQLMSDSAYNTARLWTIIGLCLLRLAVTRHHLQAYLGLAERWVEQMRREAGRITAVEIQRKITRIYCYVSVVSLQYLGPVILTLHCALLLKTLGHHSWGLYPEPSPVPPAVSAAPPRPGSEDGEDVRAAVEQITGVLGGIFTPLFFRGLLAFVTWMLPARGGRPPPVGFAAASSEPSLLGRGSAAGRIGLAWQRPWGNVLPSQCRLWGFALRSLPLLAEGECIFVGPLLWPATSELSGSSLCFV